MIEPRCWTFQLRGELSEIAAYDDTRDGREQPAVRLVRVAHLLLPLGPLLRAQPLVPQPAHVAVGHLLGQRLRGGRRQRPVAPEQQQRLQTPGADRQDALNELLFAGPTKAFRESRAQYGDLSVVDTIDYLYGMQHGEEHHVGIGRGVTLNVSLEAVGEPDDDGIVTVMTVLNGQLRPVYVRDRSVTVDKPKAEKADASVPGHVAAPFAGAVTVKVAEGDTLAAGDPVATIEAMKMEAAITTPVAGTVERMALTGTTPVEAGDLIAVVRPA